MSGSGRAELGAASEQESEHSYAGQIRAIGVRLAIGKGISTGRVHREVRRIEEQHGERRSGRASQKGEGKGKAREREVDNAPRRREERVEQPSGSGGGHRINGRSDYWATHEDHEEEQEDAFEGLDGDPLSDGATEQVAEKNDGEMWSAMDIGHHLAIQSAVLEAILVDLGGSKESSMQDLADTPKDLLDASARRVKPNGREIPSMLIGKILRWHSTAQEWMLPQSVGNEKKKADNGTTNIYNYLVDQVEGEGKRKIKDVIEQGTEAKMLAKEELLNIRNRYFKKFQGQPPECERPTDEQLSALKDKLDKGHAPYTEFAVWGPYGKRIAKMSRYTEHVWNGVGYVARQIPGPSDLDRWLKCDRVFKTAMLMLEGASLSAL